MTKIDPGFLGAVFEALMNADFIVNDFVKTNGLFTFLRTGHK